MKQENDETYLYCQLPIAKKSIVKKKVSQFLQKFKKVKVLQLRDPKNDFIFNFNFDDKMKIFEQFEFRTK